MARTVTLPVPPSGTRTTLSPSKTNRATRGRTTTRARAVLPATLATSPVAPGRRATTKPALSTVATFGSSVFHSIAAPTSAVPRRSVTVAT